MKGQLGHGLITDEEFMMYKAASFQNISFNLVIIQVMIV